MNLSFGYQYCNRDIFLSKYLVELPSKELLISFTQHEKKFTNIQFAIKHIFMNGKRFMQMGN